MCIRDRLQLAERSGGRAFRAIAALGECVTDPVREAVHVAAEDLVRAIRARAVVRGRRGILVGLAAAIAACALSAVRRAGAASLTELAGLADPVAAFVQP